MRAAFLLEKERKGWDLSSIGALKAGLKGQRGYLSMETADDILKFCPSFLELTLFVNLPLFIFFNSVAF